MQKDFDSIPNTNDKAQLKFNVGYCQNIGNREQQQDAYGYRIGDEGKSSYFVVADGMGGMEFGNIASGFAIDYTTAVFDKQNQIENIPEYFTKMLHGLKRLLTFWMNLSKCTITQREHYFFNQALQTKHM